jgi:hypothetical protein
MAEVGSGEGWCGSLLRSKKESLGTGSETTDPKKDVFASHFDGSNAGPAVCRYLSY